MMRYLRRKKGQGLVEYALILVLIAIVVIVILATLGTQVQLIFARIVFSLENPGQTAGPPVSVASMSLNASASCDPDLGCTNIRATAAVSLSDGVSAPVTIRFTASNGQSVTVTGNSSGSLGNSGPGGGSVTACVVGVQGYLLVGGACTTDNY